MSIFTTLDIARDPQDFLRRVEAGESLLIVRDEAPIAEIKPRSTPSGQLRPYGLCAGQFTLPEDFNDPLPDDILSEFEGG